MLKTLRDIRGFDERLVVQLSLLKSKDKDCKNAVLRIAESSQDFTIRRAGHNGVFVRWDAKSDRAPNTAVIWSSVEKLAKAADDSPSTWDYVRLLELSQTSNIFLGLVRRVSSKGKWGLRVAFSDYKTALGMIPKELLLGDTLTVAPAYRFDIQWAPLSTTAAALEEAARAWGWDVKVRFTWARIPVGAKDRARGFSVFADEEPPTETWCLGGSRVLITLADDAKKGKGDKVRAPRSADDLGLSTVTASSGAWSRYLFNNHKAQVVDTAAGQPASPWTLAADPWQQNATRPAPKNRATMGTRMDTGGGGGAPVASPSANLIASTVNSSIDKIRDSVSQEVQQDIDDAKDEIQEQAMALTQLRDETRQAIDPTQLARSLMGVMKEEFGAVVAEQVGASNSDLKAQLDVVANDAASTHNTFLQLQGQVNESSKATKAMGDSLETVGNALQALQVQQQQLTTQQEAIVRDQGNVKRQVDDAAAAIAKLFKQRPHGNGDDCASKKARGEGAGGTGQ